MIVYQHVDPFYLFICKSILKFGLGIKLSPVLITRISNIHNGFNYENIYSSRGSYF